MAAHQVAELLAEGEAEAGATVFAGRGAIGLRKILEQGFQGLGCDADPGIAHHEMEPPALALDR
jgi:hypothetical protein